MTIKKQVDNLIDWYAMNKPGHVDTIVLNCSANTITDFAPCEIRYENRVKSGKTRKVRVFGPRMYRGYKIVRAEKSDPIFKAQEDAFRSAVA